MGRNIKEFYNLRQRNPEKKKDESVTILKNTRSKIIENNNVVEINTTSCYGKGSENKNEYNTNTTTNPCKVKSHKKINEQKKNHDVYDENSKKKVKNSTSEGSNIHYGNTKHKKCHLRKSKGSNNQDLNHKEECPNEYKTAVDKKKKKKKYSNLYLVKKNLSKATTVKAPAVTTKQAPMTPKAPIAKLSTAKAAPTKTRLTTAATAISAEQTTVGVYNDIEKRFNGPFCPTEHKSNVLIRKDRSSSISIGCNTNNVENANTRDILSKSICLKLCTSSAMMNNFVNKKCITNSIVQNAFLNNIIMENNMSKIQKMYNNRNINTEECNNRSINGKNSNVIYNKNISAHEDDYYFKNSNFHSINSVRRDKEKMNDIIYMRPLEKEKEVDSQLKQDQNDNVSTGKMDISKELNMIDEENRNMNFIYPRPIHRKVDFHVNNDVHYENTQEKENYVIQIKRMSNKRHRYSATHKYYNNHDEVHSGGKNVEDHTIASDCIDKHDHDVNKMNAFGNNSTNKSVKNDNCKYKILKNSAWGISNRNPQQKVRCSGTGNSYSQRTSNRGSGSSSSNSNKNGNSSGRSNNNDRSGNNNDNYNSNSNGDDERNESGDDRKRNSDEQNRSDDDADSTAENNTRSSRGRRYNVEHVGQKKFYAKEATQKEVNNLYEEILNKHLNNSGDLRKDFFLNEIEKEKDTNKYIENDCYLDNDIIKLPVHNLSKKKEVHSWSKDHCHLFDSLNDVIFEVKKKSNFFINKYKNKDIINEHNILRNKIDANFLSSIHRSSNHFTNSHLHSPFEVNEVKKNTTKEYTHYNLPKQQLTNNFVPNVNHIPTVERRHNMNYQGQTIMSSNIKAVGGNCSDDNSKMRFADNQSMDTHKGKIHGNEYAYPLFERNNNFKNNENVSTLKMQSMMTEHMQDDTSGVCEIISVNTPNKCEKSAKCSMNKSFEYTNFPNQKEFKKNNISDEKMLKGAQNKMENNVVSLKKKNMNNYNVHTFSDCTKMKNDNFVGGDTNEIDNLSCKEGCGNLKINNKTKILHYVERDDIEISNGDNSFVNSNVFVKKEFAKGDMHKFSPTNEMKGNNKLTLKNLHNSRNNAVSGNSHMYSDGDNVLTDDLCDIKTEKGYVEKGKGKKKNTFIVAGDDDSVQECRKYNTCENYKFIESDKNMNEGNFINEYSIDKIGINKNNVTKRKSTYLTKFVSEKNDYDVYMEDPVSACTENNNRMESKSSNGKSNNGFAPDKEINNPHFDCEHTPSYRNFLNENIADEFHANEFRNSHSDVDVDTEAGAYGGTYAYACGTLNGDNNFGSNGSGSDNISGNDFDSSSCYGSDNDNGNDSSNDSSSDRGNGNENSNENENSNGNENSNENENENENSNGNENGNRNENMESEKGHKRDYGEVPTKRNRRCGNTYLTRSKSNYDIQYDYSDHSVDSIYNSRRSDIYEFDTVIGRKKLRRRRRLKQMQSTTRKKQKTNSMNDIDVNYSLDEMKVEQERQKKRRVSLNSKSAICSNSRSVRSVRSVRNVRTVRSICSVRGTRAVRGVRGSRAVRGVRGIRGKNSTLADEQREVPFRQSKEELSYSKIEKMGVNCDSPGISEFRSRTGVAEYCSTKSGDVTKGSNLKNGGLKGGSLKGGGLKSGSMGTIDYFRNYDSVQSIKEDILKNEKFPFIFYDSTIRNLVIYYKDDYSDEVKSKYFSAQRFGHATAKKIALNFLRSLGINPDHLENNNVFSYEKDTKSKLFNMARGKVNMNKEENSNINLIYDKKKRNVIVSWINKAKGYNFRKFSTQRFGFDVALCLSIDFYKNLGGLKEEEGIRNYINKVNSNFKTIRVLTNKKKNFFKNKITEGLDYMDISTNSHDYLYEYNDPSFYFFNNIKYNIENIRSQNIRSQNIRSQNIRSQNIRSQNIRSQNIRSQNIRSQNIRSQNIRSQNIR
ncbi:conserved Plasmodium protein, unknown function, partial [Plasmodium ovale curtisi]